MVVTHQVKHAVENESSHLVTEGTTKPARVAAGHRGSDGDVAEVRKRDRARTTPWFSLGEMAMFSMIFARLLASLLIAWERQHIGWTDFATIGAIPTGDRGVGDKTHGQSFGRKGQSPAGASEKFFEGSNGDTHVALTIDNHRTEAFTRQSTVAPD